MSLLDGDLIIVRTIGANLSSKQDAYCLVETNLDANIKKKSFVISKSSNPEWNNEFVIPVSGMVLKNIPNVTLLFTVMDENKITKDEFIGNVSLQIDTNQFHLNEEVKRTLSLNTPKKNEIEIAIRIVRISGAESQSAIHKCPTHNISINSLCKTCKKLMCSACAVSKLHNTHKIHLIEDVEGIEREEIFEFKSDIDKWINEEKISVNQLENELGNTEISTTETKQKIQSQFLKIKELLEKKESEVLYSLDKQSQFRMDYLKELLDWKLSCDQMFNDFEKLKPYDFLDLKLSKFDNLKYSFTKTKSTYQPKKNFVKDLEQTESKVGDKIENITRVIENNF
ncbi:C2 and zinc finger domain-containing protein [Naegleria gruberi]|uniref:C2 and zinc finger domain-containing protein n=1 Tax=Naegleria gruberi TaxID=5762 RepID=D2VQ54_NAEGR|nr:C2 and zinc finger domain-containing protein [Naegleria gruberi]EFC41045.1 C2 and zinc finger domain-containing protein [Naegleria gruberi]|eukprot:XP_002673789.1 C2 and zinc finger domain-containing protein [Naegleria gruberi strain NEG-M]